MGGITEVHEEVEGRWTRQTVGAQWMSARGRLTISQPWTTAAINTEGTCAYSAEDIRFAPMESDASTVGYAGGHPTKGGSRVGDSPQVAARNVSHGCVHELSC